MELHPTSFDLEALHAEGGLGQVELHVGGCAPCRSRLERLDRERATFLAAHPAAAFVRHIRQRVEADQRRSANAGWWPLPFALRLLPIGALLAVLLLVHPWLETPTPELATTGSPGLVSKGGDGPTLIVRREQLQFLAKGPVAIQAGDELRLRFALTQPGDVEAGILMTTGEWVPFFSGSFGAGEHIPEATLRVDREPGSGTILLGAPAEVARARVGSPARVQMISVEWRPLQ